jgi:hypothetical protein
MASRLEKAGSHLGEKKSNPQIIHMVIHENDEKLST